ncbi:hypothetical protein [Asticcacaulis sp. EMRT-3]|uniref:hypothetical protein n=1 Tax=Asticcacaulis sp. EMRT-3 TaxID=3040349 RepID=UPI0024AEC8A4|nr:hypothetical protein [Asticcacaulis sp. EMRT-3]MDI7774391.1 hypothetical protein [Asticcacaulis sp. EMRT-3]
MKAFIFLLAFLAMPAAAQITTGKLPPAQPSTPPPPETWLQCSYFDFNRNQSYESNVFKVDADLKPHGRNLDIFAEGFARAIHAQFKVPVDNRHLRCDTVGDWRVKSELQRQKDIAAGRITLAPDDHRLEWPAS